MKKEFLDRMKEYLQEEYIQYEKTLSLSPYKGLRINPTKTNIEEILDMHICDLKSSKICQDAFYIPSDIKQLGNHPLHLAGLFYMQEPSASSAVEVLDVQKDDWVLDLCAAPGGKSTQIAGKLAHTGFLVSNEINTKRANILLSNMERMGFSECMITNATSSDIAKEFKGIFDKVLVDAPCSGEGMFKIHESAMEDWSIAHVEACANRQKLILDDAYETLKQDGILVYSTCTYSMEENEMVIASFLQKHPDMELIDCDVDFGRCGLVCEGIDHSKVRRIFPMDQGEGHFIAKMKKHGTQKISHLITLKSDLLPSCAKDFLQRHLQKNIPFYYIQKDKIYGKQTPFIKLKNIKILRQGVYIGDVIKNRLEPQQHLYMCSLYQDAFVLKYDMNEEECIQYLKGNYLQVSGYKGYVALSYAGHIIGFGKGDQMVIKNKYPKGLRIK